MPNTLANVHLIRVLQCVAKVRLLNILVAYSTIRQDIQCAEELRLEWNKKFMLLLSSVGKNNLLRASENSVGLFDSLAMLGIRKKLLNQHLNKKTP